MKKLAKSMLPSAALIALAVWIAYHMWPVSGWGKLVWIALTYAAYDWMRQRLVFGAWLRGLVAGLILRRRHAESDQLALFIGDSRANGIPTRVLTAYLHAVQLVSGRGYYVWHHAYDHEASRWGYILTTLNQAERAAYTAAAELEEGHLVHSTGPFCSTLKSQ